MGHRTATEMEDALGEFTSAPSDGGRVVMVVRRPEEGEREIMAAGELDLTEGLVGDNWLARGSSRTDDGAAHPLAQLNLINARLARFVAADADHQAMAGDQLHVDLDLSLANLPAGTHLAVGSAVIEVTEKPHLGCAKFVSRFGRDAMRFVNSPTGRDHRLRGMCARVVVSGTVRPGDAIHKVPAPAVERPSGAGRVTRR